MNEISCRSGYRPDTQAASLHLEPTEMQHPSIKVLVGLGLFLVAATSDAQVYGPDGNRRYNQQDRYSYGGRSYGYGRYGNGGSPVDRALYDLSQAGRNGYVDHHERDHFRHAQEDLARFQDRWSQGRFDRGRLDHAIEHIQHLVNSRQMRGRDRDVLASDLAALRNFRASQDRGHDPYYGGRY